MTKIKTLEAKKSGRGMWMDLWKRGKSILASHSDEPQREFTTEERASAWADKKLDLCLPGSSFPWPPSAGARCE